MYKHQRTIVYGVSTDGQDFRALTYQGDAIWKVVEVKGLFYRPLFDRPEEDDRWDALFDRLEGKRGQKREKKKEGQKKKAAKKKPSSIFKR